MTIDHAGLSSDCKITVRACIGINHFHSISSLFLSPFPYVRGHIFKSGGVEYFLNGLVYLVQMAKYCLLLHWLLSAWSGRGGVLLPSVFGFSCPNPAPIDKNRGFIERVQHAKRLQNILYVDQFANEFIAYILKFKYLEYNQKWIYNFLI